jgi:hypothetical protein
VQRNSRFCVVRPCNRTRTSEEPPKPFPRGSNIALLSTPFCGTVKNDQSNFGSPNALPDSPGILTSGSDSW